MNFIKKNALLVGMVTGFVILLIGSILLLLHSVDQRKKLEEERDQKLAQREDLEKIKPNLRSAENVKLINENTAAEKELLQTAVSKLNPKPLVIEPVEDTKMADMINNSSREVIKQLTENGVLPIPDKFFCGFERYSQELPKKENTVLLQKQLKIIEELLTLAANSHVNQILSVKRVEFEAPAKTGSPGGHGGGPASPATKPISRSPKAEPLISQNGEFHYVDSPDYIYASMPFELTIKCDTSSLRDFLNAISRSSYVLIPRIVTIDNEKKEAMAARETKTEAPHTSPGDLPPPRRGSVPEPLNELAVDVLKQPFVLGEEHLSVGLRIDWLEFRTPKKK